MTAKRNFIELTYYETYYFANVIKNVLEDRLAYIRQIDDFCGGGKILGYTSPFPRYSAFHSFIRFVIDSVFDEDIWNIKLDIRQDELDRFKSAGLPLNPHPSKLPVNLALDRFAIKHEPFDSWLSSRSRSFLEATDADVEDYYDDLRRLGQLDELLDRLTAEVFFVLFQNRQVLLDFNKMMAAQMKLDADVEASAGDNRSLFSRPGVLRRMALPSWVRRAVFFRDRGLCVICGADLPGVLAIGSEENYDHMVPLAAGGLNDVTNIQLLCSGCNSEKRAGKGMTTSRYEAWYQS